MTEPTHHSAETAVGSHQHDRVRPGAVFACQWRLDRAIGTGGMGRVFSATHVSGRRDALKIMHEHLAADAEARARFLREAQVGRRIRSSGVVRVLESGVAPTGQPFVAMELLRGATLDALWKRARRGLPVRAVLRTMDRVLEVLAECHSEGIVHRDIKPSNVFITDAGHVRVLDFGLALLPGSADALAKNGTALGTPGFMAPEQAAGAWDHVGTASDVFSVGATLFALLSGVRIHDATNEHHAFALAASTAAPSLVSVMPQASAELVELVDRALSWDHRRRFPDAAAMRVAIRHVLAALGADNDVGLPRTAARRRALHAQGLDGTEPAEVSALAQAFSWLEDALLPNETSGPSASTRATATDAAGRWFEEAISTWGGAFEVLVMPFGFRAFEHNVWEPAPPLDGLPGRLHAAGVRAFRFGPQVSVGTVGAVLRVLQLASRETGVALLHAAWESAAPGFSVGLVRPFLLIEAAHGSEVASELAHVASLLDEHPVARGAGRQPIPLADAVAERLRASLSAERLRAFETLAARVRDGADRDDDRWRGVAHALPAIADAGTLSSLVRALAELGTSNAHALVEEIGRRSSGAAGVLARGELCGDLAAMSQTLLALIDDDAAEERLAALSVARDFELAPVARHVMDSADGPSFGRLPEYEKLARLELLMVLLPSDGERLVVRLLQRHGVLADQSHDATRRVAATVLGRYGSGDGVRAALRAASTPMWWNSKPVREAATEAQRVLETRLAARQTEGASG